jgi:hypothetical protein
MPYNNISLFDLIDLTKIEHIFSEDAQILEMWLQAIEKCLIESDAPARVYVGAQSLRCFLPLLAKYQQIAQHADVYVFAEADGGTLPEGVNITWIPLHRGDKLCSERFVIVSQAHYPRALIAQECCDNPYAETPFIRGLRTCNAATIRALDEQLGHMVAERLSIC